MKKYLIVKKKQYEDRKVSTVDEAKVHFDRWIILTCDNPKYFADEVCLLVRPSGELVDITE